MKKRMVIIGSLSALLGTVLLVTFWSTPTGPSLTVLVPETSDASIYLIPIEQDRLADAKALIVNAKYLGGVPEVHSAYNGLAAPSRREHAACNNGRARFFVNPGLYLLGSFDKAFAYLKLVSVQNGTSVRFITEEDEIAFGIFPKF